jgi:hypothetical protein
MQKGGLWRPASSFHRLSGSEALADTRHFPSGHHAGDHADHHADGHVGRRWPFIVSQMERKLLLLVLPSFSKAVLACISGRLKMLPTCGEGAAIRFMEQPRKEETIRALVRTAVSTYIAAFRLDPIAHSSCQPCYAEPLVVTMRRRMSTKLLTCVIIWIAKIILPPLVLSTEES